MRRLIAVLLCVLMVLPVLLSAALAEEAEQESFYGYFKEACWLRSEPMANTPTVDNIPERTLLCMTPVNDKYAKTSYRGQEGYVYFKNYVAVDYTDPHSAEAVTVEGFFDAPVYMRRSPLKNASTVALLPTDVRFCITYVTEEYAYLTYEGEEGYVYIQDFVQMEYEKGALEPYTAFCADPTPAYASPCYGASVGATIEPYTPVTVNGYDGDHLTVSYDGMQLYVAAGEIMRLSEDFAVEPCEARVASEASVYAFPLEHSALSGKLAKSATVTVTAFHGEYARVESGETAGYIHYSLLKSSKETESALKALEKQVERIEAQRFLNIAFTMLEETNPVLLAYNANCGGNVVARFRYGCPYLFAGTNESSLLRPRFSPQNSHYYSTEKRYLGGFDCIGFARWVHNKAGMRKLPAISESREAPKSARVDVSKLDYAQWADVLKVGDCVNMGYKGGGYHVMMYIGTLRSFGFTAEQLGLLKDYIDYPLVIHCGMNNFHTAWYSEYLKEQGLTSVNPPDGGVTISIMGIPYEKAPNTETMWKGTSNVKTFYWFDLMGYNLTVVNPDHESIRWFVIYRNSEK